MTVAAVNDSERAAEHPAPPSRAKAWVAAARPATLLAAAAPVLVGSAVARLEGGFDLYPALAALVGAALLQIGCNFANDVFDFESGADNESRLGPARAVQSGWVSPGAMRRAMWLVFAMATAVGAYLTAHAGWPVIAIGVASILAAIAYTGGPFPLGYHGLGDIFVILFFGFVAVGGTTFVQTASVPEAALWLGWPVGALAASILVVNNTRDRGTDAVAGKRTLAVRFGPRFAIWEYAILSVTAHLTSALLVAAHILPALALLGLASLPVSLVCLVRLVRAPRPRDLNPLLGASARVLLLHSVLVSAGIALGTL